MSQKALFQKFRPIFYPRSIAIIGASKDERKIGNIWAKGILNSGFTGDIYPVSHSGGEIQGLKIFPSLLSIPGPVDYVIVCIPREASTDLLDECIAKQVHAVHFFTAGFSETGEDIGHDLEAELLKKSQQGNFNIIGPNCIGTYCPEHRIPYGPGGGLGESGSAGFISQSGGIGGKLVELGIADGIKYNKGISFGNGTDLDGSDFLEYMAADPKISVIGAYLEGTRNGRRLVTIIQETAKVKPLLIWKSGRTDAGASAAKSHTGSLASSFTIWSAMLKQTGAIQVYSVEELADSLLIFQLLQEYDGKGIAIIGGFADGGGGICVSASDIFSEKGLNIPRLSSDTEQKLGDSLGRIVNILRNPVDVSMISGNPVIIQQTIETILADSAIDLLLFEEDMGVLMKFLSPEAIEAINSAVIDFRKKQKKPIIAVLPHGLFEAQRLEMKIKLTQANIPVFPTLDRAATALKNLVQYTHFQSSLKGQ